jgi:hypothetical protein
MLQTFGATTVITMTKKELLTLLFKLDRPESHKTLIRKGEDGLEYAITAIPDTPDNGFYCWTYEERRYKKYLAFEKRSNKGTK